MTFEPGDIVADVKFGHVMKIVRTDQESTLIDCIYECNPSVHMRFQESEVRLLSKTKGVNMAAWSGEQLSESIKRQLEWAKNVRNLPRKYREAKPRAPKKPKVSAPTSQELDNMSLEELEALLAKMQKGGTK